MLQIRARLARRFPQELRRLLLVEGMLLPRGEEPFLLVGFHFREGVHGVCRERVGKRRLAPPRDKILFDLARQRLLALDRLS